MATLDDTVNVRYMVDDVQAAVDFYPSRGTGRTASCSVLVLVWVS